MIIKRADGSIRHKRNPFDKRQSKGEYAPPMTPEEALIASWDYFEAAHGLPHPIKAAEKLNKSTKFSGLTPLVAKPTKSHTEASKREQRRSWRKD